MLRTHDAGTLRASDAGSPVTLAGWVARRRDHGGVIFLDLRDASGVVQVVVRPDEAPAAAAIRNEDCVRVAGTVRDRPAGNENPELPTGDIEVTVTDLRVLSEALGGPPAPGIGWALGLDRTMLALEQAGRLPADPWRLDALVLPLVPAARAPAQALVRDLRRAGLVADLPYADRTLNGHMKAAARAGARTVVLLGEQELAAGQAAVRDMTARDQQPVPLDQVVDHVRRVAGGGAP